MVSVKESEQLGLGLNLIEAFNKIQSSLLYSKRLKYWSNVKVVRVIELMDEVIC